MSTPKQPSIEQAVQIIKRLISKSFKRQQMGWWREKFGDAYADQVQSAIDSRQK